jgi:metal-responsive CopG/Arc/MetJ family transcriptional regulator
MSKRVISVRLSDERLRQLDDACTMLKMNRSQVIDSALRLLPEIASGRAEMTYTPKWLSSRSQGAEDEQD